MKMQVEWKIVSAEKGRMNENQNITNMLLLLICSRIIPDSV